MMFPARPPSNRRLGVAWRLLATAAFAAVAAPAAHATDFIEATDFSNDPYGTTLLGGLTLGSNHIVGTIDSYGMRTGDHGEREHQDMDYVTFSVPTGYQLSQFVVSEGTSIRTVNTPSTDPNDPPRNDSLFLGLYKNPYKPVLPPFAMGATGLLGWALVTQSQLGTDILQTIGKASDPNFPVPGATTFQGPLGAGTYTLWFYDGDEHANYNFNLVTSVAPVPEPASWAMMIAGIGAIGFAMRRPRAKAVVSYA